VKGKNGKRIKGFKGIISFKTVSNYNLFFIIFFLFIILGCRLAAEKQEPEIKPTPPTIQDIPPHSYMEEEIILAIEETKKYRFRAENEAWVNENVNKDFLLGRVDRINNPLFVKVTEEHTERNIYLIHPVYEAYKKMYNAALADNVKLIITSGHRTFFEQICEWELRWNDPRTNTPFPNDVEKARFLLQYRSMPGTTRHHWGTDIDLNSFESAYYQTPTGKKVYKWLKENAATYGFYQPYTEVDENRPVGYQEEKWHWSYKPLAQPMLIKYLELVSINDIFGFKGDKAAKVLPIISEWVCGINPQFNNEND